MTGWIKAHRCMLDNPIVCKDADHLAVWMWLLMNATYEEMDVLFRNERITLTAGQLLTGRKKIAEQLKISESKVQRILALFEREGQITQVTTNQNRLIAINEWNEYQGCDEADGGVERGSKSDQKKKKISVIPTKSPQVYFAKSEQQTNNKETEKKKPLKATRTAIKLVREQNLTPPTLQEKYSTSTTNEQRLNNKRTTDEQQMNTLQECKNNKNEIMKEKREKCESATHFHTPSLSDVKDFISENGCKISADVFFRYYDSRDWYVGKEKMKNWKKQILLWQSRDNATSDRRISDDICPPSSARGYKYHSQLQNDINSIWGR